MTIEEKAQRVKDHCLSIESGCDGCKLQGALQKTCYERCDIYPEEIERNYRILFGEEKKDNVNHPAHYQGKNECINVMIAMFGVEAVKHFCMCNAYKYRFRAGMKNGAEDIEKAEWYESKLIELGDVDDGKID